MRYFVTRRTTNDQIIETLGVKTDGQLRSIALSYIPVIFKDEESIEKMLVLVRKGNKDVWLIARDEKICVDPIIYKR